jgi:ribosomal protein S18 acetylase RimI-like enzyme
MRPGYEIRSATLSDVEAIAVFQTECWREAYRGLVPDSYLDGVGATERAARWGERLASGSRQVAIGWSGVEIAGVVSWGTAETGLPPLELKSLYVGAHHRGTGLASTLTRVALGDRAAQVWVFEENPRARAFYRRIGFVSDGASKIDPDTGVTEVRLVRPDVST